MKIGLYPSDSSVFDYENGRDGYTYRWYALQQSFKKYDIKLEAVNKKDLIDEFDVILENGLHSLNMKNKYLLIIESNLIRPGDWDKVKHLEYKKVFCWDDNLVDNEKYIKLNYAFDIPKKIQKKFENKKLCCTIAGNKRSSHLDELYSKRIELIRWFEENHLKEFDLYGVDWDEYNFGRSLVGKVLNKIKLLRKIFAPQYISYKGKVKSKNETMQRYKFAICYENIKDQPGYITEKIFDCFFAGCVPIYWGADNVHEHIPKECFIDKRDFSTYKELYDYMNSMDKKTYMNYLDKIEIFLNSSKADPFRAETFATTIVSEILKDMEADEKSNS